MVTTTLQYLNYFEGSQYDVLHIDFDSTLTNVAVNINNIPDPGKYPMLVTMFSLLAGQTLTLTFNVAYKLILGGSLTMQGEGMYVMTALNVASPIIINIAEYE